MASDQEITVTIPKHELEFFEKLRALLDEYDVELVGIPRFSVQFNHPEVACYNVDVICGGQEIDGDPECREEIDTQ